jgi:hypothetical protein
MNNLENRWLMRLMRINLQALLLKPSRSRVLQLLHFIPPTTSTARPCSQLCPRHSPASTSLRCTAPMVLLRMRRSRSSQPLPLLALRLGAFLGIPHGQDRHDSPAQLTGTARRSQSHLTPHSPLASISRPRDPYDVEPTAHCLRRAATLRANLPVCIASLHCNHGSMIDGTLIKDPLPFYPAGRCQRTGGLSDQRWRAADPATMAPRLPDSGSVWHTYILRSDEFRTRKRTEQSWAVRAVCPFFAPFHAPMI